MAQATATCNLKDRIYLQGEIEVAKRLDVLPFERMFVGAVGVEQLEDIAELGIQNPTISHLQLACNPAVLARLISLTHKREN